MDNTVEVQELGKVMITNRGEYIPSKSYEILDIVSYNGSSFMSKIDDNTNVPAEEISPDELLINENWQLVAKKGDTYKVTEEDLQAIAKQITDNANSAFNQNVKTKTKEFNTNATNKLNDYDTNAKSTTETFDANAKKKLDEYNANDTKKLKAYNDNADNKLSAYNTNDANKLKEYNTNADSKIEEYNTNANSKILEYDKHSEELRNMAISTDNKLERVKNEVLDTGSVNDTFINLEDSAMAELQELEVDGVYEQNTTTGKNKLDLEFSNESSTLAGMTFTHTKSEFTLNGTATSTWKTFILKNNLPIVDGKTYSLSANVKGINPKAQIKVRAFNGSNTLFNIQISNSNNYKNTAIASFTDEITQCDFVVEGLIVGKVYNLTAEVQFEENSTPTDYEPYTGGQPSPSPDYPQEIKTITGNLKITSCGRNLLKNMATSATVNGVSFTVNDDGSVLANGTATADAVFKILPIATTFSQNLILSPNKTYTLSDSVGNYTDYFTQVVIQDANGNKNWYNTAGDIDISTNVIACLYTAQIYVRKNKTVNNVLFKPQLVVKDSANLFEPYIESQIQAKLPEGEFIGYINATNRDILSTKYNSNTRVYQLVLNKYIAKITIDGTKGSFSMPSAGRFNIDNIISNYLKTSQSYGITTKCDNYISFPQTLSNSDFDNLTHGYDYGIGLGGGTANNIRIKNVNFSNVADFKNDLKQHPITLYYILNIESRRTLDLDVTDMPMSYKDITNIFTDSDLLPIINAKYYRNFIKTVQNLQVNNKALKDELNDINNRLTALENAKTTVSEELNNESEANVNDIQE